MSHTTKAIHTTYYRPNAFNDIIVKAMQTFSVKKKTLEVPYDDIHVEGMSRQDIAESHIQNLDIHRS